MKRIALAVILTYLIVPMRSFAVTYDVIVDASKIVTVPSQPRVGQLAKVYVTVRSIGTLDVEGIAVWNDGEKLIGRKSLSLKAGGSDEDVWTTWFPTTPGTHFIRVNIANDPGYPDASPENNIAERTIVVEGDPEVTSTTTQMSLTTTTTAASSSVTTSILKTITSEPPRGASRTTQKTATAFIGQHTSRTPSLQNTMRPPTGTPANGSERAGVARVTIESQATPVTTTTPHVTSVMNLEHKESPPAPARTTMTVDGLTRGTSEEPARRPSLDASIALWIGALASALFALLFYIAARCKDK